MKAFRKRFRDFCPAASLLDSKRIGFIASAYGFVTGYEGPPANTKITSNIIAFDSS